MKKNTPPGPFDPPTTSAQYTTRLLGPSAKLVVGPVDLGWQGPVVGFFSLVADDGELYDLNDYYSMPRRVCGALVRSPVEAFTNLFFFVVLLG